MLFSPTFLTRLIASFTTFCVLKNCNKKIG